MSTEEDLKRLNDNGARRSAEILSIVSQGGADQKRGSMGWYEIQSKIAGKGTNGKDIIAKIKVMRKVLTIGGIRVSANHQDAQHIADWYGVKMLTEKISDLINQQANVRLPILAQGTWTEPASPPTTDGSMSRLFRVFDYDRIVTEKLVQIYGNPNPPGLYVNEGKEWILSEKYGPNMKEQVNPNSDTKAKYKDLSCNHGWYQPNSEKSPLGPGPGNVKKIQTQGHRHDMNHNDYSQLLRFVKGVVYVSHDGGENYEKKKYSDLLKNPTLVSLLSYYEANTVPPRHPFVQKKFWKGRSV